MWPTVRIPRVKIGVQLFDQAPEGSFDLFVRRFRADAKHLVEPVHESCPLPERMAQLIALSMGRNRQAQYRLSI